MEQNSGSEKPPPSPPLIKAPRIVLAVLACVQNALIGGVIYGWASIDRGLLAAPSEKAGAGLLFPETTQLFSRASSTAMLATLVLGAILDRYGPKICSVVAHVSIALGFYLFSAASKQQQSFVQYYYTLATCLIAFGGPGIQVSVVHISNLFTSNGNQFLVLSVLTGCISISFSVFTIFEWIWEEYQGEVDVQLLFGVYVLVVLLSLVASLLFWPNESFHAPEREENSLLLGVGGIEEELYWEPTPEEEYVEATTAHQHLFAEQPLGSFLRADSPDKRLRHSMSFRMSSKALRRGDATLLSIKDQPFGRQLFSVTYIYALFFLSVTCFLANFYVASFSTEVADSLYYTSDDQRQLARIFTLIMSCGILASISVGWVMDRCGQEACTVTTILLGQAQLLVLLLFVGGDRSTTWIIVSFVLYTLFRQFLFPVFIANVTDRLGFKYFGLLNGIAFAVSGLSQFYMASLVSMVQGNCHLELWVPPPGAEESGVGGTSSSRDCSCGYWRQLHWVEVALLGLLLAGSYHEYRERLQRESQRKRFLIESFTDTPSASFNYGSVSPIHEEEEEEPDF